ncbi:hypothetical protein GE061_014142 [Apolygus lucorum]|uniref:Uncharacterized protein n=1 Tax=Apolygus lucorum TaxID=248454 RepID=A0A8S9XR14_APOLU|nr:hypothetical protein GE061_014142 [Apolygus lucorum]
MSRAGKVNMVLSVLLSVRLLRRGLSQVEQLTVLGYRLKDIKQFTQYGVSSSLLGTGCRAVCSVWIWSSLLSMDLEQFAQYGVSSSLLSMDLEQFAQYGSGAVRSIWSLEQFAQYTVSSSSLSMWCLAVRYPQ